ncbi:MAG: DNA polymerase II large subunit [Methanomassiliicoccales archaeon]
MKEVACSEEMKRYFEHLAGELDRCYALARKARARGLDPETYVEIPRADDLAMRVEKLLASWDVEGVAEKIRTLSRNHDREEVSLLLAKEIASNPAKSREDAIDRAIRVGLAVLTEGILVAPLEGIAGVKIGRNPDGSEYLTISFAGPIRSAGGTGQALSVLIGDVVRRELGIGKYKPTHGEVQRFKEEIPLYKQCQHLQYTPTNEEIELIVKNCPVCIDGEGTEDVEISGYRDLPRVQTNKVRGGACLVIAEGLCLKAPKIQKHVKRLGIDGWEFINEYLELRKKSAQDSEVAGVAPDYKYLKDIVAGRPVLSHPSRIGGFRLRYGRGRTTGLAAVGLNPATMYALDEFIAVGTQIKLERPGKAGAVTPCDSIEGPILLLDNGDLVQVNSLEEFEIVRGKIKEIVDLGEILISFGEFVENNHVLVPGSYSLEWYREELKKAAGVLPDNWKDPNFKESIELSKKFNVPLHPKYNLFWSDIELDELKDLRSYVLAHARWADGHLYIENDSKAKLTLEKLGALHRIVGSAIVLEKYAEPLLLGLGLAHEGEKIVVGAPFDGRSAIEAVSAAMGIAVRPRAVTRIGARMARPEKAKERKMRPPPHVLFPLGQSGGMQRLVNEAISEGEIEVEAGIRQCKTCGKKTLLCACECGSHTVPIEEPRLQRVDISKLVKDAMERLGERSLPEIKAVQGMISKNKTPEALEKGILRAKYDVCVFKDGTIRFDMTDVPLTHFRPREIGLSVERARELGYVKDVFGNELIDASQLCELKVQDIIPSNSCGDYLVRVAQFIDELLQKHYGLAPFYNVSNRGELIGHLAMGLAPHTSGGVLCRIIGFTDTNVGYGHPFFHAAKRRNADGDEDSCILLLDALINFSRSYLPDRRGGLMDAPLVLTTRIDPNEIDKEAHNIDVAWSYPLEFFEASTSFKHPKELQEMMDLVAKRIGSVLQYEGFGFTHDTTDISAGPKDSSYKTLETMIDKMNAQIELAKKIRAVDETDVVYRVITRHFLPDMIGNLNSFSGQRLRCTKCNANYRRMPLKGKCYCGANLTLTVHEKGIKKYLEITKEIGNRFGLPSYTLQRIALIEHSINSLFENDKVKKCTLADFM